MVAVVKDKLALLVPRVYKACKGKLVQAYKVPRAAGRKVPQVSAVPVCKARLVCKGKPV